MDEEHASLAEAPKHIVCKEKEGMYQIILNRPPVNAFNIEMVEEIYRSVADLQYRTDLKVLVLSATGKAFSGGFSPEDIVEDRSYQLIEAFGRLYQQLQSINIPVLALIHGIALGAGAELVMFADLAIATESSKFGFPDVRMGLFPAMAANVLQRIIPPKKAAELIFTGEIIVAKEAERLGLINMVVPDDKLQEQAGLMVGKLLQFSAPVLQLARRAMLDSQNKPLDDAIRTVEEIYLNQLLILDDSKEGVRAFTEKRKPVWKNQ
jgi:cyclohexa-1,5-dienecarbonyl-CoA hydratase